MQPRPVAIRARAEKQALMITTTDLRGYDLRMVHSGRGGEKLFAYVHFAPALSLSSYGRPIRMSRIRCCRLRTGLAGRRGSAHPSRPSSCTQREGVVSVPVRAESEARSGEKRGREERARRESSPARVATKTSLVARARKVVLAIAVYRCR